MIKRNLRRIEFFFYGARVKYCVAIKAKWGFFFFETLGLDKKEIRESCIGLKGQEIKL